MTEQLTLIEDFTQFVKKNMYNNYVANSPDKEASIRVLNKFLDEIIDKDARIPTDFGQIKKCPYLIWGAAERILLLCLHSLTRVETKGFLAVVEVIKSHDMERYLRVSWDELKMQTILDALLLSSVRYAPLKDYFMTSSFWKDYPHYTEMVSYIKDYER